MNITAEKNEIIEWINSLDDLVVIEKIKSIKRDSQPFDFDKEWKKAITIEQARKRSKEYISGLPWKS